MYSKTVLFFFNPDDEILDVPKLKVLAQMMKYARKNNGKRCTEKRKILMSRNVSFSRSVLETRIVR